LRNPILFLAALLFVSTYLYAQEDAATELVKTVSAAEDFEAIFHQEAKAYSMRMEPAIEQRIKRKMTEDELQRFESFWFAKSKELISVDDIEKGLALVYEASFTNDELVELNVFYQSILGQKLLAVQPALTKASQNMAQEVAKKLIDKDSIARITKELIEAFPEWFGSQQSGA
jgi:hypothetical protein